MAFQASYQSVQIAYMSFKNHPGQSAWVAQSGKHLTLDFHSGHDLMVCEIELCIGLCADSVELAWNSLSPSLCFSLSLSLSLSKNK